MNNLIKIYQFVSLANDLFMFCLKNLKSGSHLPQKAVACFIESALKTMPF